MKKSVLVVLYYYHPYVSGLTVLAKTQAEQLVKRGYDVTVLCCKHNCLLPTQEVIAGVKVLRTPVLFKFGKGVFSPLFFFKAILLTRKHDYVNPHLPMADFAFSALFIPKKKIIVQYHCDLNLGPGFTARVIEKLSYFFMAITLGRARKIIVTSLDYFQTSRFSYFINKAIEIYPPIDENLFQYHDPSSMRERLQIPPSTFLIGFVGRIVYEKGLPFLLQAIPILKKEISDFRILVVGDSDNLAGGSVRSSLQDLVDKYSNDIQFVGFLNAKELCEFYSMINTLVLPSIDPLEAFGMVQIEAMHCGTPVVASDMPGVRIPVKVTGFGRLAEPRNSHSLAKALIDIYSSRASQNTELLGPFYLGKIMDRYEQSFS